MTTVSGIVRDNQQSAIPNAGATLVYTRPLVGWDGGVSVQNVRTFTANGDGLLTMPDLIPGYYELTLFVPVTTGASAVAPKTITGTVPSGAGASLTLEAFVNENAEPVTSSVGQQAIEAANAAAGSFAQSVALQSAVQIRAIGGNHTAQLIDAGHLLTFSGAATLTIPAQASVAWPAGTVIAAAQLGAATLTVAGAAGVTVTALGAASTTQGGALSLIRVALNNWLVLGDLT